MTIAIGLRTTEGIILGSDSTTTLTMSDDQGNQQIVQVFNSAQKIFEIGPRREQFSPGTDFSGGIVTYGSANFGPMSWRALINEFYCSVAHSMNPNDDIGHQLYDYSCMRWNDFISRGQLMPSTPLPSAGLILGAVPKGSGESQASLINFESGIVLPLPLFDPVIGGMSDTATRIMNGYDPELPVRLAAQGVPRHVFDQCAQPSMLTTFTNHMPLRDAIDFVHFLIYATIKLHRFKGVAAMVGGAIEIAVITPDRGFRWIMHKPLTQAIGTQQGVSGL